MTADPNGSLPAAASPAGAQPPVSRKSRRANERSRQTRSYRLWAVGLLLLLTGLGVAGWLWFTRERPIETLSVAAGPYRSDSFELMREVADVLERQSDFLRLKVVPTRDSSRNISVLNAGGADLATIRSDTPVAANVQIIADLFPDYFLLMTRPETSIRGIADLHGKVVAIPPFGTDEFRSFWAVADHYDLPVNAVRWITRPFEQAADGLLSGELDAIFTVRSLRDRLLLNLFEDASLKRETLSIVEIEQAPAIAIKRPFLSSDEIPKGAFGGNPPIPRRDTLSSTVKRLLVTRDDVDPEIIAELTRILFENRLDLVIRFALASAIIKPEEEGGLSIPLHEGSERYYFRDQPSFLQENAEPIALMITIAAMLGSGLLALRARLTNSQKNRMDSYNYRLLDIADKARNCTEPAQLRAFKGELYTTLETVVRALDTDEVTEEGFQSFSLLWESVREMLNDRQAELSTAHLSAANNGASGKTVAGSAT